MISHISIRDFAIIDELELDLYPGLNIITGETGAGKSIVIEAVSVALGSRADMAFVRSGKEKAYITLVVDTDDCDVSGLLEENDIPCEDQLIIRREISSTGKSLCRVNGVVVNLSVLSRLCKKIADIHGQYDHQSLLNPEYHIRLLDLYDEERIAPAKERTALLYRRFSQAKKALDDLTRDLSDSARKRDFMAYELQEIEKASPLPGEDESLEEQIRLMQNSEQIYRNLSETYEMLFSGSPSATEGLGKAMHLLGEISHISADIASFSEGVADCYYKLEDLGTELRRYRDSVSFSPEELDGAISRLDLIDGLKRKFGGSLEQVFRYRDQLSESLANIENADARLAELTADTEECRRQLDESSRTLSGLRRDAAQRMTAQISAELAELNFNDAALTVDFKEYGKEPFYTENGIDTAEILISANRGEQPKPLARIASGGEISRIMLAFKRIIGDLDRIPTMIFDEIDTGISGITASIVGRKLLQISGSRQVICITHLPQIAAFGDHHYKILKQTDADSVHTTVVPLMEEEKVDEIARLLGGLNITETTKRSAEELLTLSRGEKRPD